MGKLKKESKTTKVKLSKTITPKKQKSPKVSKPKKVLLKKKKQPKISEKSIGGLFIRNTGQAQLNVDDDQLKRGIQVLLDYNEKQVTKELFNDQTPIFVQITCIKIPQCPNRRLRINLKHSLTTDKSEICLIVPDLKRGRKVDHEPTIEHYEELLKSKDVTCVKRILPMRQLRVEYDQFELKRRLCGYYDYFLADGRISGHLSHLLGQTFYEKRKLPIPIRMTQSDLKAAIEEALRKTTLSLKPTGNSYSLQVGHTEMSVDAITDNLKEVIASLAKEYPGGWANIRSLHLKTPKSIAVPVYVSLKSANDVVVPIVESLRSKSYKEVRDDLSTLYDTEVSVDPTGNVTLHKVDKRERAMLYGDNADENMSDDDDDYENEDDNPDENADEKTESYEQEYLTNNKPEKAKKVKKSNDDEKTDDKTESYEQEYLTNNKPEKAKKAKKSNNSKNADDKTESNEQDNLTNNKLEKVKKAKKSKREENADKKNNKAVKAKKAKKSK